MRRRIERIDLTTQKGTSLEFTVAVARAPSQHAAAAIGSRVETKARTGSDDGGDARIEAQAAAQAQAQSLAKVSEWGVWGGVGWVGVGWGGLGGLRLPTTAYVLQLTAFTSSLNFP